ncbi:MAG: hypothetical protein PHS24_01360 [Bacilli bacterium]|nr:hypothetical protein [Bacilli bacterium]
MEKNMNINFACLKGRVLDALDKTDLEYIRNELLQLKEPTIVSGVGGSSVVSEIVSKVIRKKNEIITKNMEPRDFNYDNLKGYKNVLSCSYSGNNYGVDLAFNNNLKHYLLSNNAFNDLNTTYLTYNTSIEKERSFISLGATLIPITIVMDYYLNGQKKFLLEQIQSVKIDNNIDIQTDIYEIFTGYDTSMTSKYLESTMVESGIGIPIIHDKYSYCHGRSTTAINCKSNVIYLNRDTDLDKLLIDELLQYHKLILVIDSKFKDDLLDDYQMLIKAMYLTKFIANQKQKDLSKVNYSPIVKKLYKYNGKI